MDHQFDSGFSWMGKGRDKRGKKDFDFKLLTKLVIVIIKKHKLESRKCGSEWDKSILAK